MILVTGANGMVGSYFAELSAEFPEELDLTDRDTLDVRDWPAVRSRIRDGGYSHVIHLAAETDVDRCEVEPDHAYRTNAFGTQNVALACGEADAVLVYTSTAGVFGGDGAMGPFTETDAPCPANVYGRAKLEGERAVEHLVHRYFIVRAGWMMGGGPSRDKKFVAKILAQVGSGREIMAVNDKVGSPTFARELVLGIRDLIATGRYGLYHMTNHGVVSRYDVARRIASTVGSDVSIVPVGSDRFPLPAPRADSEAMRNEQLGYLGIDRMSSWEDALDAYLAEWRTAAGPRTASAADRGVR
ncbi:MAG: NAD(P)-dependent oxidoreductase [Elusimicrobia bacterium]|nr:NAD(P)-dependent oxidoreductase [Elusimicrobiota bacterium]